MNDIQPFIKFVKTEEKFEISEKLKEKKLLLSRYTCLNCGIKLSRKYLYFIPKDNNFDNKEIENIYTVCLHCKKIRYWDENCKIIVLARNQLDHLEQKDIIYYFRYLLVLKYLELNKNKNVKTLSIFYPDIVDDLMSETFETMEEIFNESEDFSNFDDNKLDFKTLIDSEVFYNFINKYFIEDEYRTEEIEETIKILPLFHKDIFLDKIYLLELINNLNKDVVKNDIKNFLKNNPDLFNIKGD